MNKLFMAAVSAAFLSSSLLAAGIEFKLNKAADWQPHSAVKWIGPKKDVQEVKGGAFLASKKLFDVNTAKKYTIEAEIKMISGDPFLFCVGFEPYDKQGRRIPCEAVNICPGSETTVAKAAKKGALKLFLKVTPRWNKKGILAVALNAKKDYSDLPNFNVQICKGYKTVKGLVEVTLKKPLSMDVAAGTAVRGHFSGGYMYAGGNRKLASGQSFKFKGSAKGRLKFSMGTSAWAPGAAKARVILLINWGNWGGKKAVAQVKNVKLEIEK